MLELSALVNSRARGAFSNLVLGLEWRWFEGITETSMMLIGVGLLYS